MVICMLVRKGCSFVLNVFRIEISGRKDGCRLCPRQRIRYKANLKVQAWKEHVAIHVMSGP